MASYIATKNFYMEKSDRQFDEGKVYDLQTYEAEEINKQIAAVYGEEWLKYREEGIKEAEPAS
jgi:hypothetical protein